MPYRVEYPSQVVLDFESLVIQGITAVDYDNAINTFRGFNTGFPYPEFVAALTNNPVWTSSSFALDSVIHSTCVAFAPNVFQVQAYCPGGIVYISTILASCPEPRVDPLDPAHGLAEINQCLLVLNRIRCRVGEAAVAEYTIFPLWDGVNRPVEWAFNLPVTPYPTPFHNEVYTIGGVVIDGFLIDGITEVAIEFNPEIETVTVNAGPWPTWISLKQAMPTISVECLDLTRAFAYPQEGTSFVDGAVVFFQRLDNTHLLGAVGGRLGYLEFAHIAVAAAEGLSSVRRVSMPGTNEIVRTSILLEPNATPTGSPVVINTEVQIELP